METENIINPPIMTSDDMIMNDAKNTDIAPESAISATPDINKFVVPRKTKTIIRKYDKKIGRNDPCPCGSGKKYKNCCLNNKDADYNSTRELTAQEMSQIRYGTKTPSSYKEKLLKTA